MGEENVFELPEIGLSAIPSYNAELLIWIEYDMNDCLGDTVKIPFY